MSEELRWHFHHDPNNEEASDAEITKIFQCLLEREEGFIIDTGNDPESIDYLITEISSLFDSCWFHADGSKFSLEAKYQKLWIVAKIQ